MRKKKRNSRNTRTVVNRQQKDTLFRMIFKGKAELLSLYNAMNGTHYENPEMLEIVTLENAIYMNMKNDLAFIADFDLHLYEHQSTKNPNMPLRNLFYVAKEYEALIDKKSLYGSKLVKLPTPKFITFYNGREEVPEYSVQKLSDAYEKEMDSPDLELKVHVYNVNKGKNAGLMEKCRTLRDYSIYVARVREYARVLSIEEAVDRAVDECIREGVLEEFLRKNRAEARNMSIFEYDEEKEMKLIRQDEREIGRREKLSELIRKKLARGQTAEVIAEALEESVETIQEIIEGLN